MAPKWFSQNDDHSILRSDNMAPINESGPKKPSRLSATFGSESRPWNFMSSASDRSSSSSRKRLSLFGARSSTASSADVFSSGHSSPRDSTFTQPSRPELPRTESRFSIDSKRTIAGTNDSWRSSIFSRRRSTKTARDLETKDEPLLRWLRGDGRSSSWRRSSDYDRDHESEETYNQTLKKKDISAPFNFQHVTHTQQNQLPEMGSVTDSELVSEFWAASAFQAPKTELRGIKADTIDSGHRPPMVERPSTSSSIRSGSLALKTRGLSSASSVHDPESAPRTPSQDGESPLDERARSMSLGSRSHSFSRLDLPSRERLAALGAEQREPPTMVHPALRGQNTPPTERTSSQPQLFDLPATSLESVPEEMEGCGPSPAKSPRAKAMLDLSPLGSPKQSPRTSPSLATTARHKNGLVFTPFPIGNAFAQAHGGAGAELPRTSTESRLSFSIDGNVPSLTSGESWENDIDFCYLVEAESSCDFDWESVRSSRKGSASSARRDSTTSVPGNRASFNETTRRASTKSQPEDDALFADFDSSSSFAKEQTRHDSPQFSHASRADLSPILESPAHVPTRNNSSETVSPRKSQHTRSTSLDEHIKQTQVLDRSARWSIASPFHLPEDAKRRGITFTHPMSKPRPARMSVPASFAAPPLPPPKSALPPLPTQQTTQQPTKPVSPPLSPTSTWPSSFPTMRRPSSAQDRAILQAAGRFVRNGRASSRPTTPSRLSHVQHAFRASGTPSVLEGPTTPHKTTAPEFKLAGLYSPPMSPPDQHQGFQEYPAWI